MALGTVARELERLGGRPAVSKPVLLGLWGLLFLGIGAVGANLGDEPVRASLEASVGSATLREQARVALELPQPYVFPQSESSPGEVTFSHAVHVDPAEPRCAGCHVSLFRLNAPGALWEGQWTRERIHEGELCASCHDGQHAFAIGEDCILCHL